MNPFKELTGIVSPILDDDMNTDQIIPSAYLKDVHANLGEGLFAYLRRKPDGEIIHSFVLEQEAFKKSKILLVGDNFGCGSSREHAVWALQEFGIQCLIGKGFADLFRENCLKNGVLTISLDQESYALVLDSVSNINAKQLTVSLLNRDIVEDGQVLCNFKINDNERHMLLNGLDDIGLTLGEENLISKWEKNIIGDCPFLQTPITDGY
jgi:3-isopropylmalate/(R)-2-methylmalate dehydratase small subunit